MRAVPVLALLLAGCGQYATPEQSRAPGFAFASQSITLPAEAAAFPSTPAGELLTTHCTACHSADFVRRQPRLGADKWGATVKKMREAYHAPFAETDDAKLVAALVGLQH